MILFQVKQQGDNFSYIIADEATKEAAVVDPSFNVEAITQLLTRESLNLKYIVNTHHHSDHTAGNEELAVKYQAKIVAHRMSRVKKDIAVNDGDSIRIGKITIRIIHTPGHSPDSISLLIDGKLLTGDTLFIGECGRTDLTGGNASDMYHSLFDKLMKLSDEIEVYPGHDYGPRPNSTIGQERKTNYTLEKRTLEEFIEFMKEP